MRAFRWWQPFPLFLYIVVVLLCPAGSVHAAQGSPPIRIIFMHHSTGQGLLDAGDLRAQLTALGYIGENSPEAISELARVATDPRSRRTACRNVFLIIGAMRPSCAIAAA